LQTEKNKYLFTTAYIKILNLIESNPEENVFVIRGGQGASKTISILQLIIQSLATKEKEATVLSSELSKMKRTVIRDYKKICKDWGTLKNEHDFNKSESKHDYFNGSYLDFLGADVNDVGKGFRRDILYINEADKMDVDTAVQFISRAGLTIIDYNPDALFWGDEYINENNFLTLTFQDNEYLPESEVKSILDYKIKGFFNQDSKDLFNVNNIKNRYWANKWKVYGCGLVGSLDGVVFDNWEVIDGIPEGARLLGIGLDFGYSNDPSAAVEVYKYNDKRILNEVFYRTGMLNGEIAKSLPKNTFIYADSAEPKSIEEIRRTGVNIMPVKKGADSIVFGIQTMQTQSYLITSKSTNVINEFQKYTWIKDKSGIVKNKPIDKHNHAIDAIRYHEMMDIGIKDKVFFF
jgi:phage terminase large subunit